VSYTKKSSPLGLGNLSENSHDVRVGLSDVTKLLNGHVAILKKRARAAALTMEDLQELGMCTRMLTSISNEDRHVASLATSDLGHVSDDDLEQLAAEAKKVLGK